MGSRVSALAYARRTKRRGAEVACLGTSGRPAKDRVIRRRMRKDTLARTLQIPAQRGRGLPDRPEPNRRRRTIAVDHYLVRAGAQNHTRRGLVPDDLRDRDGHPWARRLLLLVGRDRAATIGNADWFQWWAADGDGRVLPRRVHRHCVGVLSPRRRSALLRRWVLRDHRTVSGGGVAGAAASERHGGRLRRRQPGQGPGAARARTDRRLVKLRQPAGDRRSDLSRLPLSCVLVRPRRLRLLADRAGDERPLDRGNRQGAQRTRARNPYGHLKRKAARQFNPLGPRRKTFGTVATAMAIWWRN